MDARHGLTGMPIEELRALIDRLKLSLAHVQSQAKLANDNMTDDEKLEKFNKFFIENIQLKKKIRVLEGSSIL